MTVIRKRLKHLKILDVSKTGISDAGISSLCTESDVEILPPMVQINLLNTTVNFCGVRKLLKSFPELRVVKHQDLQEIVVHMFKSYELAPPMLQITSLYLDAQSAGGKFDKDAIIAVAHACPNVQYLHVQSPDKYIDELSRFTNLRSLTLKRLCMYDYYDRNLTLPLSLRQLRRVLSCCNSLSMEVALWTLPDCGKTAD